MILRKGLLKNLTMTSNITMKNLIHHFPTCYAYSVKKPIGELNLKRALDEDTGVFSLLFSSLSSSSPLATMTAKMAFICLSNCVQRMVKSQQRSNFYSLSLALAYRSDYCIYHITIVGDLLSIINRFAHFNQNVFINLPNLL